MPSGGRRSTRRTQDPAGFAGRCPGRGARTYLRPSRLAGRSSARRRTLAALAVLLGASREATAAEPWTHYAADAARRSTATVGPADLAARLWLAKQATGGDGLEFEGGSGPVVAFGKVFVNARVVIGGIHEENAIVAFDAQTGAQVFAAAVEAGALESWSSPAVDESNRAVLLGSGSAVWAVDADDGAPRWFTPLPRPIVNASPLVPPDRAPGRAFMTDYDPFAAQAQLYCINTSPFDSAANPYQPGDIVWQEPIGSASGATPAFHEGVVYLASISAPGNPQSGGRLYAFDANAPAGTRLRWTAAVTQGFFGGVCYCDGYVFAATYSFSGAGDNARLVKVRATDGAIQWVVPAERSASIPVVRGNRVFLSAGLEGFGSHAKVQAFRDDGASAAKLWDTWTDTAGTLRIGGWNHQPAASGNALYVGAIPATGGASGPYTDLYRLDLDKTPVDPGFILAHRAGVGSSPAAAGGRLFSLGAAGLYALAACGDFDGDGRAAGTDVQPFVAALLSAQPDAQQLALGDLDNDGSITPADAALLADKLLGR